MYLWLDDIRTPPTEAWTWAKDAAQAIALLEENEVEWASLDHDLADEHYAIAQADDHFASLYTDNIQSYKEMTGYDVVLWLAEHGHWPTKGITIHSWNPVGGARMAATVDRYGPYETRCRHTPAQNP